MINRPKVSIIVPVYNSEKFIERCLTSIINQTLKDIEIIVIDDGSKDESLFKCSLLADIDSRIKIFQKKNEGLGLARNYGLKNASGEYVAFVDSDDYIKNNMYLELYQKAKETGAEAIISGAFITVRHSGQIVYERQVESELVYCGNTKQLALEMMGSLPNDSKDYTVEMSVCKGIYSLDVIKENNICFRSEREYISEDLIFHFDFFQKTNKAIVVPKYYYYYCENMNSLTKKYSRNRFEQNVLFYEAMLSMLRDYKYGKECQLYAHRMLISRARVCISLSSNYYKGWNDKVRTDISEICNNKVLSNVLSFYPISELPIKQRVFTYLMKKKMALFLFALAKSNQMINLVFKK